MLLTYANIITILGFLALFVLAYFLFADNGLGVLITSIWIILSDFIDGMLARKFNQRTKFGEIFDPIRDRAFILIFYIYFLIKNPSALVILLILLTIVIEIISAVIKGIITKKHSVIDHTFVGKARMLVHCLVIFYFIINKYWLKFSWPDLPTILLIILFASLFAAVSHFKQLKRLDKQFIRN